MWKRGEGCDDKHKEGDVDSINQHLQVCQEASPLFILPTSSFFTQRCGSHCYLHSPDKKEKSRLGENWLLAQEAT